MTFWSEIGSGFGELGGTPPPGIPRSTPRGCPISPGKSASKIITESLMLAALDEGEVYKEESLTTKQRDPPRSYSLLLLSTKVKMFVRNVFFVPNHQSSSILSVQIFNKTVTIKK